MSVLLEVESLAVDIGALSAVRNISFRVAPGEVLGLVGASGSGKSLTALALMRLLPAAAHVSGQVRLQGQALSQCDDAKMRRIRGGNIGMVFQEPMRALNPLMSIGEQVAETVRLHPDSGHLEPLARAREVLDSVGLIGVEGDLRRLPFELSGGQRQRVAIAIAMALSPALLIADEPTTALDVITQAQILKLLKQLVTARGMGLLLISHDLAVISQLADRVAVMHAGELVEMDATPKILASPKHAYTRTLIGAAQLKPRQRSQEPQTEVLLSASGIVKTYPQPRRRLFGRALTKTALDDVSLEVHPGETVGLVGESGSGKSTLLRVMMALLRADRGGVSLLGSPFSQDQGTELKRLRRSVQAVFQDPYGSFDRRWTVERLISEPFYLLDLPIGASERLRRVGGALEQVGLKASDAARLPHEFSGGERQRIAIARALITEPALIAFDEAVSALDVLVRQQILDLLADLATRRRLAYLFVTHDLHVVRAIADRIYVLKQGRVVESGPVRKVFETPEHPYTRALIEATPTLGTA